jgi:hypothetical protein
MSRCSILLATSMCVPISLNNVCGWDKTGRHVLAVSLSHFDPNLPPDAADSLLHEGWPLHNATRLVLGAMLSVTVSVSAAGPRES